MAIMIIAGSRSLHLPIRRHCCLACRPSSGRFHACVSCLIRCFCRRWRTCPFAGAVDRGEVLDGGRGSWWSYGKPYDSDYKSGS